jgi:large subunit ribosomal protein L10e
MARKPAVMYRSIKQQPYTRKEYMGGIPTSRIIQFVLGNKAGIFPVQLLLCINEKCQIRHTALESARITSNRFLEKSIGVNEYRLKIRVYPHHVLRENKQATGAGADRVSQGMRASFGKAVGIAARVRPNQVIMSVETFERHIEHAKEALRKASCKLPSSCKIKIAS